MRRELWISLLLLIGAGFLLEYTATAEVRVERQEFARFPEHVGGRNAVADPISTPVLKTLALSDYLSRNYVAEGLPSVNLYIGFYASQRTGATYHSPKNCLPGGGWQMVDTGDSVIPGPDGTPVVVNEIVIQRALDKQVVLYWYHDRGRVVASEYLAKIYMVWDAATRHRTDGALVRVIVPVTGGDEQHARDTARGFATEVMNQLPAYLPG